MTETESASRPDTVVLIGMRGSGKTTVGRSLAQRLRCTFLDTDEWIVDRTGRSIAEIFQADGEVGFRRLERQAIDEVCARRPRVASVGGGAIVDPRNVNLLQALGVVIWLDATPEVLWSRIGGDPASPAMRPPLTGQSGLAELRSLIARRSTLYRVAADHRIDTSAMACAEVVVEVGRLLGVDVSDWR